MSSRILAPRPVGKLYWIKEDNIKFGVTDFELIIAFHVGIEMEVTHTVKFCNWLMSKITTVCV